MTEHPTMRALVAYESMFGNTERVARAVAAGLRLEGIETTVVNVCDPATADLADVDLLVVGAPTHGFSLSRPTTRHDAVRQGGREEAESKGMREWLSTLPDTDRPILAATFDTRVTKVRYLPASASRRAARALTERGHRMVSPPIGFLVQDVAGPLESREVDRAIAWSRRVATEAQARLAGVTAPWVLSTLAPDSPRSRGPWSCPEGRCARGSSIATCESRSMETQHLPSGCVVVGVDAAQLTDRALDWASDQAALEERHLLLVHGIGTPLSVGTPWGGLGGPDPMQVFSDLKAAGRALLARATTRAITRHPELVVHQVVRAVDPRQALLDVSTEAALIVVGSRGRGHVLSVVLGSVSEEVAGLASCPVVVIRPQHSTEPRRGVLVGTDGTPESQRVLAFAFRHARLRGLPLTVLHTVADVGLEPARQALAESVAELGAQHPDVTTTLEIGHGSPAECLLARADEMDLVVVGHHERGRVGRFTHGSVAVAVLEHASVAIAVVPLVADSLATAR